MYHNAATVLDRCHKKMGSLKSIAYSKECKGNQKLVFALVVETLKYRKILAELLRKCNILNYVKCLKKNESLAMILVYDLLFGKGLHGKYKMLLAKYEVNLQTELAKLKAKVKVRNNDDLLRGFCVIKENNPRYVRINTLKSFTLKQVIDQLSLQYKFVEYDNDCSYQRYIELIKHLKGDEFLQDLHIPELLVFSSSSKITTHQLYHEGYIIFQDKASCLPAFVLSQMKITSGSCAIDCCAAPGNKTSHLAAILQNTGNIFAFDKDGHRLATMKKLLSKAGVSCVKLKRQNFLTVNPADEKYKNVEYAIVDPSCSGSGITSRLSQLTDDQDSCSNERLQRLASFQTDILCKALSFPQLQYAVYSTCSVHASENEQVVESVLRKLGNQYKLVNVLPELPHRGLSQYTDTGPKCVRLSSEKDYTNGFFVACFKRISCPARAEFSEIKRETDKKCTRKKQRKGTYSLPEYLTDNSGRVNSQEMELPPTKGKGHQIEPKVSTVPVNKNSTKKKRKKKRKVHKPVTA